MEREQEGREGVKTLDEHNVVIVKGYKRDNTYVRMYVHTKIQPACSFISDGSCTYTCMSEYTYVCR